MQQLNAVHSQHHQAQLQNLNVPKADELQSQIKTALNSAPQQLQQKKAAQAQVPMQPQNLFYRQGPAGPVWESLLDADPYDPEFEVIEPAF